MHTVLFACVHNAGRSQMAAALFNAMADPTRARALSAGTQPAAHVHPEVVAVMRERDLDLSSVVPQRLTDALAASATWLITMGCGEACPAVPNVRREDWPLADPKGRDVESVRAIREEIRARVAALLTAQGWWRAPVPLVEGVTARPICAADDPAVASIIRDVMTEFRCTGSGFAIHDPEVGAMARAYPGGRARFFVVEEDGVALGCGGFGPLAGEAPDTGTCELRKMYFRPRLRGRGVGERLLRTLLGEMRDAGFRECYLETTSWMDQARKLYARSGFRELEGPRGRTGHGGCDRFFVIAL